MADHEFEVTAATVDKAIEKAEKILNDDNLKREDAKITVLDNGSKGILGFKKRDAKVLVHIDLDLDFILKNFFKKIIDLIGLKADVITKNLEDRLLIEFVGEDKKILIGKHGCILDAFQDLANALIKKYSKIKVQTDAGNYRVTRMEKLKNYITSKANFVLLKQKDFELQPMCSYERRIVHETLKPFPSIKTLSVGEKEDRHIVIKYCPDK